MSAYENALPISDNLRLDKEALDRLVAVVLDANAYGDARPNMISLTALAQRLHSINIQTWVPEPVAWEWAHHLCEDWTTVKTAAAHQQRQLRLAGLQPPELTAGYADEDAVIQAFLDKLAAVDHVEIIPLTGPSAAAGLRDQVLQRGPASRKGKEGVKTGASDSAWLRDVIARAGATTEPLLFITEDKDIARACTQWSYTTPVTRKLSQIRATVFEVELDTGAAAWLVLRYLAERMPVDLRDQSTSAADALLVGNTPGLIRALDPDRVPYHEVTDATLTQLTALVGIDSVTVEQHDSGRTDTRRNGGVTAPVARTVMASVYFLADAEATTTYRNDYHATSRVVTHHNKGLLVRATLAFELLDQMVTAVRPEADAHVADYSSYDDDADALWEVGEALTLVPGLELPDDWGPWERDQEQEIQIPEHDTVIELYWSQSDNWALSMVWGEEEVQMRCEYDVNAFVGGSREGAELYPPYYIVTEGTEFALVNPVWSVPAWILSKLLHIPRHTSADR